MEYKQISISFLDSDGNLLGGKCMAGVSLDMAKGYAHCMANVLFKDEDSANPATIEYKMTVKEPIDRTSIIH